MSKDYSNEVEQLYTTFGFNAKLLEVEQARKQKNQTEFLFGLLLFFLRVFLIVSCLVALSSGVALFTGGGITYLVIFLLVAGIIYALKRGIDTAKNRIRFAVNKYLELLFYLKKQAIEAFVKLLVPQAEEIIFEPDASSTKDMMSALSNLFYRDLNDYNQRNNLSFKINQKAFKIAESESVFVLPSNNEQMEVDKFIDRFNKRQPVCFIKGVIYQMEFERDNLNSDSLTLIIPKNVPPVPTISVKQNDKTIQVCKDNPRLELSSRDKRRPNRFIKRDFEEYSVENQSMEENFYVFTNNENSSRKLLSYRLMELIVRATAQKPNQDKQKLAKFFSGNQQSIQDYWIEFSTVMLGNNKPLHKLTVLSTNRDLTFFELTGEKSCTLDNFLYNFQKLEIVFNSLITGFNMAKAS